MRKEKPHCCQQQLYVGLKEVVAPFRGGGGKNLMSLTTLCNQKGGSRKPAELTRSPTDPGSHTLSIHLRSTDTSPFLTWTIFLPSLTDLLAT
jgi:hypothetical protein